MSAVDKPNILFLLPDQHRRDWTSLNRNLPLRTPNIERIASSGVAFTHAYTPSPLCAPARACLAAGRGYSDCKVPDNSVDYPLDLPTYYQRLRDRGYRVGGVGKFDLHKATLDWGLDGSRMIAEWGFTDGIDNEGKFDGSRSYRADRTPKGPYMKLLADHGYADVYAEEHEKNGENRGAYTTVLPDSLYCDNWVAENARAVLDEISPDTPWHLVVNFTGPHNPMDVTESMRIRWSDTEFPMPYGRTDMQDSYDEEDHQRNRQNYAAMIENIDSRIGELIDLVDSRGELERTIIVYASDHGEMLGDHLKWGKSTWHEPSVGIPLIVSTPGTRANGSQERTVDSIVSLHDLAATFLDAAGADQLPAVDAESDSRSLLPLLSGETDAHRTHLNIGLGAWRVVVDAQYKLVMDGNKTQLFDLEADPCELHDLSQQQPSVVERLKSLVLRGGS